MNHWIHKGGRYRETSILGKVHTSFFNHHQLSAVTYMPDEIVLARMITAIDFESEKVMHDHNGGYKSHNDYGLAPHVMRPVCIY